MSKAEKRESAKKAPKWIIEVDVRAVLMLAVTVLLCLLFLGSCFLFVRSFLPIRHFELVGVSRYDEKDIINASLLKRGDKLYAVDFDEIENKVLEECPYLESVEITARFPNTVRFSVEEKKPQWYIELAGDFYVLDSELVMMTETASQESLAREGVTKLVLPNLRSVMKGELPNFGVDEKGNRDETEIRKTLEIISAVRQTTFKGRVTELDLSNRFDIKLTVDSSYYVSMGDVSAFEAKLKEVERVLASEKAKQHPSAEIDVSGSPVYFKPIDE